MYAFLTFYLYFSKGSYPVVSYFTGRLSVSRGKWSFLSLSPSRHSAGQKIGVPLKEWITEEALDAITVLADVWYVWVFEGCSSKFFQ